MTFGEGNAFQTAGSWLLAGRGCLLPEVIIQLPVAGCWLPVAKICHLIDMLRFRIHFKIAPMNKA